MKNTLANKIMGVAAAVILAASLVSCESRNAPPPVPAQAARVWPEAPAEARLAFGQSIYSPKDLGINPSALSRFGRWLIGKSRADESFVKPFGIAVDDEGDICLTDTGAAAVCYFDRAHHKFQRWTRLGKIALQCPVAVAKKGERFFVADSALGMVIAFDSDGVPAFILTNSISRPVGLALSTNQLFVVDSQLHHVAVFDLSGRFLSQFGRRGVKAGEFNFPTHIATDKEGHVLVTDSMNSRVQMFDTEGRFLSVIGAPGDSSGHFGRPKGVAVDNLGHVYVMDAMFDNMQVFDESGQFLLNVGAGGTGPGEFWLPSGIAISGDNQIFVADSYNRRIEVFKYIGTP
jgi:DNA-binding beta-propeller fold protein YncE